MFSAARWRLTFVFTVVLVLILGVSGVAVYLTTRSLIYDQVDAELAAKARNDLFLVDDKPRGGEGDGEDPGELFPAPQVQEFQQGGYFFAVTDESGRVVDKSGNCELEALASPQAIEEAIASGDATTETRGPGGETQRLFMLAVTNRSGEEVVLQMGRSIEAELETLSRLRNILLAVVAVSIAPAMFGGYLLSGRALRPIKAAMDGQRAFIADASHELRTPVAVVRTNAELLEKRRESGRLGQSDGDTVALHDILDETDRLGRMVGQMLTLAQADAGQTVLHQTDVSLGDLAGDAARSMRTLAGARGVDLDFSSEPDVWVHADPERLREVLVALLDNAVKYTPSGGRVSLAVTIAANRKAVISVRDTGPGIPPEALPHLFERFYREDAARSREQGGAGLGLAIARHIVEAHGGSIRAESEAGKGTTMTVELRLRSNHT
jgi:signal transduction histidine kinase